VLSVTTREVRDYQGAVRVTSSPPPPSARSGHPARQATAIMPHQVGLPLPSRGARLRATDGPADQGHDLMDSPPGHIGRKKRITTAGPYSTLKRNQTGYRSGIGNAA
jgi:hypothetical protein